MSDVSSASYNMLAILAGTGPHFIVSRAVVRAGGSVNEALVPGCVLQADTNAHNLEPWNGTNTPLGILLQPITATTSAQLADVLVRGHVKPEHVHIFNATANVKLTAAQWNQMKASGLPSASYDYRPIGAISGALEDEDGTARAGIVVTLKDAAGTTIGTATSAVSTGAYSFTGITTGEYYLNVPATSVYYATTSQPVSVTENATTTANITSLFKVGSIAGICTDDDTPAVELEGVSLICYLTGHSGDPEYGPVLSGADGAYEFENVRVGTAWIITASLTGHDTETVSSITVETDTETELDIVLDVTT